MILPFGQMFLHEKFETDLLEQEVTLIGKIFLFGFRIRDVGSLPGRSVHFEKSKRRK